MQLIFIYGPAAAGKLTVGRALAEQTGLPLFHNHRVVDALLSVFPFGSEPFIRLREEIWMAVFEAAAREGRSLIFTFAPEPTVESDFPGRVLSTVGALGGQVRFVALTLPAEVQRRRIDAPSRHAFRKLTSPALLEGLREGFYRSLAAMPVAEVTIDTSTLPPEVAAERIASALGGISP